MVLIYNSPRTILRKSIRIHQRISSIQKRPKATLTEKSVSKGPQPLTQISKSDVGYGLRLWHRFGSPYKLVQAYGRAQNTRPYATQVGSLVVIWCCGDLLAQSMEEEDYNPWRTLRHMVIGAVVAIPSYKWYGQGYLGLELVRLLMCLQVHVPGPVFQLRLKGQVLSDKGRCQSDRIRAAVRYIFLWNAITTGGRQSGRGLGAYQKHSAHQLDQLLQIMACCDRVQFYLHSTPITAYICRSVLKDILWSLLILLRSNSRWVASIPVMVESASRKQRKGSKTHSGDKQLRRRACKTGAG